MKARTALAFGLLVVAIFVLGCSSDPGVKQTTTVKVSGSVTGPDGKPVKDVRLNFNPNAAEQFPASVELKSDGKFEVEIVPGKYFYSFEGKDAKIKAVPAKYHSPDAAHTVDIQAGQDVSITLTN